MALRPSRWGDPTRAVAMGATPVWGGGGMAWNQAAVALRRSLASGTANGGSGDPPLPSHPAGRTVAANRASRARRLNGDRLGWNLMRPDAARCHLSPPPPANCLGPPVI